MTPYAYSSFARAQAELSALIAARFGNDADMLDDLKIGSLPLRIEGSDKTGTVLFAHPKTGIRKGHEEQDLVMTIYAKAEVMPLVLAKP